MTPIINPWLFYLVDTLDVLQVMFILVVIALAIVIMFITLRIDDLGWDEKEKMKSARRTRKIVIFFSILLLVAIPLIPSKDTCYKMMVASQITDTNIQKAEDVIKDSVDYIFEKIDKK